jgi:GNAT superfamily N-acetyltransferase
MDAGNLGFLARQLLLTEVSGEMEDAAGGCLVWGKELWAGLWQIEAMGKPEQFIIDAQQAATARGVAWRGILVLIEPASSSSPAVAELEEAFYVYGFPRREGIAAGGPQTVQILEQPPKASVQARLRLLDAQANDSDFRELLNRATRAQEQLAAPWAIADPAWLEGAQLHLAELRGTPAGIGAASRSALASRVISLWVDEQYRGQGVGTAILEHMAHRAQDTGSVLSCVWCYRDGKLRYFFSKAGYSEKLTIIYFVSDSA